MSKRLRPHAGLRGPRRLLRSPAPKSESIVIIVSPPERSCCQKRTNVCSKRLKEMKQLTRGTGTSSSRSKGSGELQTISLPSTTNSSKKQPGFSAVGQPAAPSNFIPLASGLEHDEESGEKGDDDDQSGAVRNGWASEAYDPAFVSGCGSECRACGGQGGSIAV